MLCLRRPTAGVGGWGVEEEETAVESNGFQALLLGFPKASGQPFMKWDTVQWTFGSFHQNMSHVLMVVCLPLSKCTVLLISSVLACSKNSP